jgi:hypothetical protein
MVGILLSDVPPLAWPGRAIGSKAALLAQSVVIPSLSPRSVQGLQVELCGCIASAEDSR